MVLCAAFSYKTLLLLSTPYVDGINYGITKRILDNLHRLIYLLVLSDDKERFFKWFVLSYLILITVILIVLCLKRKIMNLSDKIIYGVSAFILISFLGGYIVFYNTTFWTLTRGLSIGLLMATFLLCLAKIKVGIICFSVCAIIGMSFLGDVQTVFISDRFSTEEWREKYNYRKIKFEEVFLAVSDDSDPWSNTLGVSEMNQDTIDVLLALPKGIAVNAVMNGEIITQPGYILISKVSNIDYNIMYPQYKAVGYGNIYEDIDFILMRKN